MHAGTIETSLSFPYSDCWEMEDGLFSYSSNIEDVISKQETYTASIDIFFFGNYSVLDFWTNIGGVKISKETVLDYMTTFITNLYTEVSEQKAAKDWIIKNIDIEKNQLARCITPSNTVIEFSKMPELDMYYLRCYTQKTGDIVEAKEVISTGKLPDFTVTQTNTNPYDAMSKTDFIKLTDFFVSYTLSQGMSDNDYQKLQNSGLSSYLEDLLTFNSYSNMVFPEFNGALNSFFDESTQSKNSDLLKKLDEAFKMEFRYSSGAWRPYILNNKSSN